MLLENLTWPEVKRLKVASKVVVLPLGSFEQHGHHIPVRAALRELKTEFPKLKFVFASYWSLAASRINAVRESELGGLGHACEMETSLMLHLHPTRVRMKLAKRDGPKHKDPYRKSDM